MKHHTNVGETSEAKTLVQRIDKSVQRIDESVHHELPPSAKECFVYKVHEGLRKVKPEAYEPVLVSIGPYHIQNKRLPAMKQHKLRYLHSLLKRTQEGSVKEYVLALQELEDRARECYVEPIDHLSSDDFVEMMLLDGCFIIEYFHKILDSDKDDLILKVDGMRSQICLDLILLENQLPYFVLSKLYEMTIKAGNHFPSIRLLLLSPFYEKSKKSLPEILSISDMAMQAFASVLPKPHYNFINAVGNNDTKDAKHLLHLLHILCTPSSSETSDDNNEVIDQNPPLFHHLIHIQCAPSSMERTDEVIDQNRPLLDQNRSSLKKRTPKNDHNLEEILLQMRSVVELQEAGVKFKKTGKTDSTVSLFDIKFGNGLMEIPCFYVQDSTDTLLRNLIAYEQHSPDVECKYFTDFAVFMDRLITTEKDVNLLRLEGILVNLLGDDNVVSELFNRLGDGVIISSKFCYSEECGKVNEHCKKSWNKMMAKLRGDYFNNPWASVSTVAAGLLLLLTIVQTIVALLALFT